MSFHRKGLLFVVIYFHIGLDAFGLHKVKGELPMVDETGTNRNRRWTDKFDLAPSTIGDYANSFRDAEPFPHLVVDALFPESVLRRIDHAFEIASPSIWKQFEGPLHRKLASQPGALLPKSAQEYFDFIYSNPFIRQLTQITGIDNLIPDPALYGGGMHEVSAGDSFDVHLDFVLHPRTLLRNRLVMITYLNDSWKPEVGGALELWNEKTSSCAKIIAPLFGRTVILEQSPRAIHGQPVPIREGYRRRSVIAYYYTNGLTKRESDDLETVYFAHKHMPLRKRVEIFAHRAVPKSLRNLAKAFYRHIS
jgi:2OG-Fe(II) oxygenase superfamily